jgi:hypothetical protein
MKKKTLIYLLVFFIFHFLSIFSMVLLFHFLSSSSSSFFYVINILFFIQITYFIFCKFYIKFKKMMVRESFLWFFLYGVWFFSVLCLLRSFFITLCNTKKITLLYRQKFHTNRFVGNFLQSTYKIDMCHLACEKHMLFK